MKYNKLSETFKSYLNNLLSLHENDAILKLYQKIPKEFPKICMIELLKLLSCFK